MRQSLRAFRPNPGRVEVALQGLQGVGPSKHGIPCELIHVDRVRPQNPDIVGKPALLEKMEMQVIERGVEHRHPCGTGARMNRELAMREGRPLLIPYLFDAITPRGLLGAVRHWE